MNSATDIKAPGFSGQYAIETWESEGGGPAGAGDRYDLAHIAQADNAGWRASNNSTGWLVNRSLSGMSKEVGALAIASALADNDEEDQVLRSLGAAVITRWNTIPTKLQRELFDDASSGELLQTDLLKGQIARFLHKHKDDAR